MVAWTPGPRPSAGGHALLDLAEVAQRIGLSPRTIRFYEEQGLVVPEKGIAGGHRLYFVAAADRLELIKRMMPLGIRLEEMVGVLTTLDRLEDEDTLAEECVTLTETLDTYRDFVESRAVGLLAKAARGREFGLHLRAVADHHRQVVGNRNGGHASQIPTSEETR
jgi:DNA-binding transcriptional MerR regulator